MKFAAAFTAAPSAYGYGRRDRGAGPQSRVPDRDGGQILLTSRSCRFRLRDESHTGRRIVFHGHPPGGQPARGISLGRKVRSGGFEEANIVLAIEGIDIDPRSCHQSWRIDYFEPVVGADNASGTHDPGHYIRDLCATRDRLRAEGDVAMARWPIWAGQPRGGRSAPTGGARDWPAGIASGKRAALCTAQAGAPAELRRAGLSPGRFGLVSRLCPPALGVVTEEIGAAPDDRGDSRRDLGGDQPGPAG